jgi:sugar lactone lactonase YvrE/acetyl esterase/lipase
MPRLCLLILTAALLTPIQAQNTASEATSTKATQSNLPYVENGHERQVLDVYAPPNAKNLPVVFWLHGGGWQTGDKTAVQQKPQWFMDQGFVFVAPNYRLLPDVDMGTLIKDVAKAFHWVQQHVSEYGGNPQRVLVGGHSAGAQLAALICTDPRYLKDEGHNFDMLLGCIPVDGDTYDVPAMIETAETRQRVHGLPLPKFGHRIKFSDTPENHKNFSAVTHVAKDHGIPPFLLLYVADHPDTTAQALRLGAVLKAADVPTTLFGAKDTKHSKINEDLGLPDDPTTAALAQFLAQTVKDKAGSAQSLIADGAKLEKLADGFSFTEGPSTDAAGNVYFTDQPQNRIHKWSVEGKLSTFLEPAGRANGLCFDAQGNLWACADEHNELWRIDMKTTKVTVMAKKFEGKLLNGPNDVWVAPNGGSFFTDPFYKRPYWKRGPMEQSQQAVYFLSPDGQSIKRVTHDLLQPNGIVGTPDGKTLYITDIKQGKTFAYDIQGDGALTNVRLFCAAGYDGMTLDEQGNLYGAGKGITVHNKTGQTIEHVDVPESWTANVCFGGKEQMTLFITASKGLYALKMKVKGASRE